MYKLFEILAYILGVMIVMFAVHGLLIKPSMLVLKDQIREAKEEKKKGYRS